MCIYVKKCQGKNLKIHLYRVFLTQVSLSTWEETNLTPAGLAGRWLQWLGKLKCDDTPLSFFFSAVFHVYFRLSFCPVEDAVTKDCLLTVPLWNLLEREVSRKHLIFGFTYFWITNNFGYSILLTQYMNRQCCLLSTVDHFYSFLRCCFEIVFWIHQIQAMKRMCTAFCSYFFFSWISWFKFLGAYFSWLAECLNEQLLAKCKHPTH